MNAINIGFAMFVILFAAKIAGLLPALGWFWVFGIPVITIIVFPVLAFLFALIVVGLLGLVAFLVAIFSD